MESQGIPSTEFSPELEGASPRFVVSITASGDVALGQGLPVGVASTATCGLGDASVAEGTTRIEQAQLAPYNRTMRREDFLACGMVGGMRRRSGPSPSSADHGGAHLDDGLVFRAYDFELEGRLFESHLGALAVGGLRV
jgi:hypothetical protein